MAVKVVRRRELTFFGGTTTAASTGDVAKSGAFSLGSLVVLNLVWRLFMRLGRRVVKWAESRRDELLGNIQLPSVEHPLFCAVDERDAVNRFLQLLNSIASLGHKFWN